MSNFDMQVNYWAHMLDESTNMSEIYEAKMTRDLRESFDALLRQGIVEFEYYKKEKGPDGLPTGNLVRRQARGTLNPSLVPSEQEQRRIASSKNIDYDYYMQSRQQKQSYMVPYWDLDAAASDGWGWRQFHVSRFIGVTRSTPYAGSNASIRRNGNTFIHTNRVEASQVTPQLATTINSTLRGILQTLVSANPGQGTALITFRMQDGIPTLVYNFDISANPDDIALFRLTIEDIVRQIYEQHGVLVEKIKADIDIAWNE